MVKNFTRAKRIFQGVDNIIDVYEIEGVTAITEKNSSGAILRGHIIGEIEKVRGIKFRLDLEELSVL